MSYWCDDYGLRIQQQRLDIAQARAERKLLMAREGIHVYRSKDNRWRWRYTAKNGLITADGSEGYATKWNAKRAARRTGLALAFAKVMVDE